MKAFKNNRWRSCCIVMFLLSLVNRVVLCSPKNCSVNTSKTLLLYLTIMYFLHNCFKILNFHLKIGMWRTLWKMYGTQTSSHVLSMLLNKDCFFHTIMKVKRNFYQLLKNLILCSLIMLFFTVKISRTTVWTWIDVVIAFYSYCTS